jgi:hypothetical protein
MSAADTIQPRRRWLRALAINVAVLCGAIALGVGLAEVFVRIAAPQQLVLIRPDLWQPADTVGWLRRPNVNVRVNTGERPVDVITDDRGFRIGAHGPVEADQQVLLLGDSFMEALQVQYEQSASGLLEASLPALVGAPVAVRNAGVGGWNPEQYALYAASMLARDDYDAVVTSVYLRNDVIDARRGYYPPREHVERHSLRIPRRLSWGELTNAILRPFNDYMEERSHLCLAPLEFPPEFLKAAASAPWWDVTAGILQQIDAVAAEHGIPALFVLIPAPVQVDSASLMQYVRGFDLDPRLVDIDQPNRELGGRMDSLGLRTHDLLSEFRAAHVAGAQLYGRVDTHFSPEGNELFAQIVAPMIADLLASTDARGQAP